MRMRGGRGLVVNIAYLNLTYIESERGVFECPTSHGYGIKDLSSQTDSLGRTLILLIHQCTVVLSGLFTETCSLLTMVGFC